MNEQEYKDFVLKRFNETKRQVKPIDLTFTPKFNNDFEKRLMQGFGIVQAENNGNIKVLDTSEVYKDPQMAWKSEDEMDDLGLIKDEDD